MELKLKPKSIVQNAVPRRSPQILAFPKGSDLFSLFQISLANYFDLKFKLWKEHGLDPAWLEGIPFYEYQIWIDKLNTAIEEDNNQTLEIAGKKSVFTLRR